MRRFFDLLPIRSPQSIIDGGEGNTRCLHARELGRVIGLRNLWVKVEGDNPSRSTKDRQGTVVIAALREIGVRSFVMPSTGNSCTALARLIARFPDMHMHVFVGDEFLDRVGHADAPNVSVHWLPDGSFVDACEAAVRFAQGIGAPCDAGFVHLAKREALKSVYLEAASEVAGEIELYVQGVSSGIGVVATRRAAAELRALGRTRTVPRLVCVQERSCDPMVRAFDDGATGIRPQDLVAHPRGLAKATLRGDPSRSYPGLRAAVLESEGTMVSVGAPEMEEARLLVARTEGLEVCHASAMTIAAARHLAAAGWIGREAVVLLNLTGAERPPSSRAPDFVVERRGEEWIMTAQGGPPRRDIVDAVAEEVRRTQGLPDDVGLDANTVLLEKGLALDSVAVLDLLLAIEQRFGRRIEEHEVTLEHLGTIGDLAALVSAKLEG